MSLWEVSIASLCMDLLVTSPSLGLPDLERCLPEEWLLGSEDHSLQARQDKLEQLLQWLCQLQLLHKDSSSDCYSRTLHCPPPSVPSLRCIMQFDILFRVRGSSSHRTMTAFMEFMCLCSKVNSTNGEPGSIAEEQACSTGCSLHTTHYSLLTTHFSLLTTHYSLLTIWCPRRKGRGAPQSQKMGAPPQWIFQLAKQLGYATFFGEEICSKGSPWAIDGLLNASGARWENAPSLIAAPLPAPSRPFLPFLVGEQNAPSLMAVPLSAFFFQEVHRSRVQRSLLSAC